jgi:O-antigen/teichoic acid export membrane protein
MSTRPPGGRLGRRPPAWVRPWLADSAVLLVSQAFTLIGTSAAAVLIARQLDARDWGLFAGLWALSMALSMVIQFGASTWLLRELSRLFAQEEAHADQRAQLLIRSGLVLNAGLGLAVVGLGLIAAVSVNLEHGVTAALVSLLAYSALLAASGVLEAELRARRRVRRVATATFLEKGLLLALLVAGATLGGGVAAIGIAYLVAGAARVAFVRWSVFGRLRSRIKPTVDDLKHAARESLPFALTSLCIAVIPKLDAFLLLLLSATSAGYFALGDRILGAAFVFPDALSVALYPFFSRNAAKRSPPWLLAAILGAVGGGGAIAAIITAPTFVPLVFGSQYTDAVPAVRVVLLALPILFMIAPLNVYGFSQHQERRIALAALSISLVGSAALVTGQWAFGVVAAAGAYVGRQVLFLAVLAYIAARPRGTRGLAPVPISPLEATSA